MKKLLSVFAAAAMLFGFASCSGDLHDDVKAPIDLSTGYYLVGNMTGWDNSKAIAFEDNTEVPGTYVVKFQATEAEIAFAFIPELGSWNGQIGGNLMVGGTLPANAKYESKDNGNGGFNGTVSGLEAKANYKMVVTPNDDGTLKLDVSSNVPPTPVYLHNMYVRGGMVGEGWGPSVDGSLKFSNLDIAKGIVTYYVDFVCTDTANNEFGVVDGSGNWAVKYTGANITVDGDYVVTTLGADNNNSITGLEVGKAYRIFVQTNPEGAVSVAIATLVQYSITGCKLVGYETTGDVFFLEAWIPGNAWSEANGAAILDGEGNYVKTFAAVNYIALAGELADKGIHIQIVDWDGASGFWDNKVTGGADAYCTDVVDGGSYTLVFDASTNECYLEKNN